MGNKPSTRQLRPEALSDLRKQTEFTEAELQQWYADFIRDCPKGSLTKKDFKRLYNNFFSGDATAFTEHVFRTFDANRDGTIDFREFMCGMSILAKGSVDQKLRWIFSIYDINKNGFISREEMLEILQALFRMIGEMEDSTSLPFDESTPEKKLDKIFRKVDRNGDDQLSFSEFLEAALDDPQIMELFK